MVFQEIVHVITLYITETLQRFVFILDICCKFNLRLMHFYTRLHFAGPSVLNNSDEEVYLFKQEMMKTTFIYPRLKCH